MYVMKMAHTVLYHEHRTSFPKIVNTILNTIFRMFHRICSFNVFKNSKLKCLRKWNQLYVLCLILQNSHLPA